MPPTRSTSSLTTQPGESVDNSSISAMLKEVLSSQKRIETSQGDLHERMLRMETSQEKIHNSIDSILTNFKVLEKKQVETDKSVQLLLKKSNMSEQHSRNFSMRIFNLDLPTESSKDCLETAKMVYSTLLAPILGIAVEKGSLDLIPPVLDLIDYAHVLPVKSTNGKPPVIVRLKSRLLRDQIFKYKPVYYRTNPNCSTSIFEDLTADNFKQLKMLQADENILKAWTRGGQCKFIYKSNPNKVMTADLPFSAVKHF